MKQEHDSKMPLKVVCVYVYPVFGGEHDTLAKRFLDSYVKYFPETPHELVVVSNGGNPTATMLEQLNPVSRTILVHDDTGWDIGAYRKAAAEIPCDLMVFFGGASYIRGPRWLERMVEAYESHKDGAIYGCTGSLGHQIHIRTTGFWCAPKILNEYPYSTDSSRDSRYNFEHGPNGFTKWALQRGLKALMVTWNGMYEYREWDTVPGGFHNNVQEALLCGDRLTCQPYYDHP